MLATQARTVVTALGDTKIDLGPSRRKSSTFNRAGAAEELLETVVPLEKALADVARERREAEATLTAKKQVVDKDLDHHLPLPVTGS